MYSDLYISDEKKILNTYLVRVYNLDLAESKVSQDFLNSNLNNIISLKLWREQLREMIPEGPSKYLDEIISNFNQLTLLGALGFGIPCYMLLRRSAENLLAFLYYIDHPIEYYKKQNPDETRNHNKIGDLQIYIEEYPFIIKYQLDQIKKLKKFLKIVMDLWKKQYSMFSNYVHGTNSNYLELKDYLDEIHYNEELMSSLSSYVLEFSSLVNALFILFFFEFYNKLDEPKKSIVRSSIAEDYEFKRYLIDIFGEI